MIVRWSWFLRLKLPKPAEYSRGLQNSPSNKYGVSKGGDTKTIAPFKGRLWLNGLKLTPSFDRIKYGAWVGTSPMFWVGLPDMGT